MLCLLFTRQLLGPKVGRIRHIGPPIIIIDDRIGCLNLDTAILNGVLGNCGLRWEWSNTEDAKSVASTLGNPFLLIVSQFFSA